MGSILPCFWDRDPPLWLGGPWPARPPPVTYKPHCPLVLLEPRPLTASSRGAWQLGHLLARPLAHFLSCSPWGSGGSRDPTCS